LSSGTIGNLGEKFSLFRFVTKFEEVNRMNGSTSPMLLAKARQQHQQQVSLQKLRSNRQFLLVVWSCFSFLIVVAYLYYSLEEAVTFFIIGDFGVDENDPIFARNLDDAKQVSKTMWSIARWYKWPRAVFMTGDVAYPHGILDPADNRLETVFRRIPTSFRENVEFYAIPGNHDCEGSLEAWSTARQRIPSWISPKGAGDDKVYGENKFDLPWGASLRLISLDTCGIVCSPLIETTRLNHRCGEKMSKYSQNPVYREDKVKQLKWLESVQPKNDKDWMIVMGHWPVYSFRGNGPTRELSDLLKWMKNNRVDLYLCGEFQP
jgi:tartrate-resistant acid phosphatase type 5